MHRPVLILGAEPRVAVAVARSLHRQGIPAGVAGFLPAEQRIASRAIRHWFGLPNYRQTPEACTETLMTLLSAHRFDMVIPITDTALTLLVEQYERLRPLTQIACPHPDVARRVLDKRLTFEAAARCDVPVPATYRISSLTELDALGPTLRFPLIAKPEDKGTHNPFKLKIFRNLEELVLAFRADARFGAGLLIQEFATGSGVGIGVLMHDREPVAMFQHRRLKELPATGGVSVTAVSEALDPALAGHAVALLREIEWEGVAMVEYKYDRPTRRAALMEVNGRYWGSVSLAVQSGVDFPFLEWQVRHGQRPARPPPCKEGVRWRWGTGDLLRTVDLLSRRSTDRPASSSMWPELGRFLADFGPGTRGAMWSFSDPLPAAQEFGREAAALGKTGVKHIVRSLMPAPLLERLRAYRALRPPVGRIYLQRQLTRALRVHRDRGRPVQPDVKSVVFVCHGNIMRSALAEAMLRDRLGESQGKSITVTSAGTHARAGKQADPRIVELARESHLDLTSHRAAPVTRESLQSADLVVAMDFANEAALIALAPEIADRIRLLGSFGEKASMRSVEIPDPFEGDAGEVRRCYAVLEACVAGLAQQLVGEVRHRARRSAAAPRRRNES